MVLESFRFNVYVLYGFAFGVLCLCLMRDAPKVFVQYPTPFNAGTRTYRDMNDSCYRFRAVRTACARNNVRVEPQT